MARVNFVKAARKDNPVAKKGESYYWWQNYGGPVQYSKTPPKRSQTIGSDKLARACAVGESLEAIEINSLDDITSAAEALRESADEIEEIAQEYEDSAASIRDTFSESQTADDCEEKAEQLRSWKDDIESTADELENVSIPDEVTDEQSAEERQQYEEDVDDAMGTAIDLLAGVDKSSPV